MDKILIPTDGTKSTEKAAEFADKQAKAFSAEVHVLCVQEMAGGVQSGVSESQGYVPSGEEVIEEHFDAVTDNLDHDVTVVRTTEKASDLTNKILEYSRENSIDQIIMGTSGKSGVKRVLLGSIAEKVIRQSEVPTTTVKAEAEVVEE